MYGVQTGNKSLQLSIAVNIVPFLLSVNFIRIRDVIAERFSEGFVTGSSSPRGTGLIADGKYGHFSVCLYFELIPVKEFTQR